MTNIKRIFIVVLLLTTALGATAQFHLGVKGGLNIANIQGFEYSEDNFELIGLDPVLSFHVGLMAEYMFTPHFGIESGLYYNRLGGISSNLFMTPQYIQMPTLFLYKFRVARDFYLYPSAGFYVAYGIAGTTEFRNNSGGISMNEDFFDKHTNKFDAGSVFAANMQYKKFLFSTGFEIGLIPIYKDSDLGWGNRNIDLFNRNFKTSVGFIF